MMEIESSKQHTDNLNLNAKRAVLFIGHDSSQTGAPMMLLELIKWLKAHCPIKTSVLLKRGGEMETQYREIAPTRRLDEITGRLDRRVFRKLKLSTLAQPNLAKLYPAREHPIVYANTVDTCDIALQLAGEGRHIIQHIHELSYSTDYLDAANALKKTVPFNFTYIAASYAVKNYLGTSMGIPGERIHVVHEFPIALVKNNQHNDTKSALRLRLGISEGAFIVGMCGTPEWRKGTDLFVQLALHMRPCFLPGQCHFVWVGGKARSQREALYDVEKAGLRSICHFIPAVTNPEAYFGAFDVFALTSREEPFSIAMLEAAASGLPIVCFAGAGGAPELVENDAGLIVPYLDIPEMAKACVSLLRDNNRRRQLGENARAKVQTRYMLGLQAPKILSVIEHLMGSKCAGNS